jgi:hypothetical protein
LPPVTGDCAEMLEIAPLWVLADVGKHQRQLTTGGSKSRAQNQFDRLVTTAEVSAEII